MGFQIQNLLHNFYVIGVSYSKTAVSVRELFALSKEKQQNLLEDAKALGVSSLAVLSTCNRTEIYTQTENFNLVKRLLVKHAEGSIELLEEYGYFHTGEEAVKHLYRVGAGLDSQILGDFQIIGQLKDAYRTAEKSGMINTLLNRIFSHVFQASKKVKNQTEISNGAASVSHAAVQYIKNRVADIDTTNFLLYGTGEIGKVTCDNLVRHMKQRKLTLINRSADKAESLATKYNVFYKKEAELAAEIAKADVIIVATGANKTTVEMVHFQENTDNKLVLDLSVPRNVASEVGALENVHLVDVDELSQVSDEVLQLRKESIPKAQKIIAENYEELCEWIEMKHLSPIFQSVKQGLEQLKEQELAYHRNKLSEEEYQKVDFIASNIVNRIARMGIMHIKDVFKSEESSFEVLAKMFPQTGMRPLQTSAKEKAKCPHGNKK